MRLYPSPYTLPDRDGWLCLLAWHEVGKQMATGVMILLCLVTMSLADDDHEVAQRLRATGKIVPVERLIESLNNGQSGHILEVTLHNQQGRLVYIIEYLDAHGKVWIKQYDASSGALLGSRRDK